MPYQAHGYNEDDFELTDDVKESLVKLQMQVLYLQEYIEEKHPQLHRQMEGSLALGLNGELLFSVTRSGFNYYDQNKEILYNDIRNKTGCSRIHIAINEDSDCYVQSDSKLLTKNVGQFLPFGMERNQDDHIPQPDTDEDELYLEAPSEVASLQDICDRLPASIRDLKLDFQSVVNICDIVYHNSVKDLLEELLELTD